MNKTTNINTVNTTKNNSFSCNRVKMLSNFYLPVTKYQMIVYAIAAFAISIISILLTHSSPAPLSLKTKIFTLLIYSLYWCPMIFSVKKYNFTEVSLPISGNEKIAYYFSYSFIIIPLIVICSFLLGVFAMCLFPNYRELINTVMTNALNSQQFVGINIIHQILIWYGMVISTLFSMICFKKNKVLMAIIFTIIIVPLFGTNAILGFFEGFFEGYSDGRFIDAIPSMEFIIIASTILTFIYNVIMTYFTARTIKRREF